MSKIEIEMMQMDCQNNWYLLIDFSDVIRFERDNGKFVSPF